KAARHSVATVETPLAPCASLVPPRPALAEGLDLRNEWPRSLVECRRKPHAPGGHQPRTPTAWTRQPPRTIPGAGTFQLNRRIRNRTYGGVGGRRGQPRLLPDAEPRSLWGLLRRLFGVRQLRDGLDS